MRNNGIMSSEEFNEKINQKDISTNEIKKYLLKKLYYHLLIPRRY